TTLVRTWWPTAATLLATVLGGVLALADRPGAAEVVWGISIAAVTVSLIVEIVQQLRRRQPGVDVIALLAMIGAILLGEFLAGAIIALMLTTGRSLEDQADSRARRELTALVDAAPRSAHRRRGEVVEEIPVEEVAVGDVVVVRPGEIVPVDGVLLSERAVLDESALTGESRPVERAASDRIASGAASAGAPIELRATATEADSTYRGLIRLVEQAQAERAPFARLADRVALWFVPFTLVVAAGAWLLSGDPVRVLAVLVVATPCPLILATPIAITSGMSRMAQRGVIVKGGGALETLARAEIVLLDKTGTITAGRPRVLEVQTFASVGADDLVGLAASLDQVSAHVFAPAIVHHARDIGATLAFPSEVEETPGMGIAGRVGTRTVELGRAEWLVDGSLPAAARAVKRRTAVEGSSSVFVSVDGELAGALLLEDPIRAEAVRTVRGLRRRGVHRVLMVTGDRAEVAELVGGAVDVDGVLAERSPADKVVAVQQACERGITIMVGDGVNDAPALAHADLGIAMGGQGATASSEAADVVIVIDRFDRLEEAVAVAQRTRRIAWQSIQIGMGLAIIAMGLAAVGFLTPVAGALVQEVIDVVAILSALRALRGGRAAAPRPELGELSDRLREEHQLLQVGIDELRTVADGLETFEPDRALDLLQSVDRFLTEELVPHELAEEEDAYPVLAATAGAEDPTPPLRHTHREIVRLSRLLSTAVAALDGPPTEEDLPELRRLLYGLYAVLRLHLEQEEEAFGILDQAADPVLV
ncbi:MAG: heavy metal translocating P-type ATPase, partial [Nitriliruptoraceae bacterium]